jgi:protocatechuate 3,4-dioxygenase beta subunit
MTRWVVITLLTGLTLTAAESPKDTSSLAGKVTDEKGAPVAAADVRLRNLMTEETEHVAADENGAYRFSGIQPGRYSLLVERPGYSAIWIRQVVISPGEKSTQNVTLRHEAKRAVSK